MSTSLMPESFPRRGSNLRPSLKALETPSDKSRLHLVVTEGLLKVHSAPHRGSFSEVLSEALRAAGLGRKVMVAQFLKGGVKQGPEGIVQLCGGLEWIRPDIDYCFEEPFNETPTDFNDTNAFQAINEIWDLCKLRILQGNLDQLVLDEIGLAIDLGYLEEDQLITTLEKRSISMDVILTGPAIPSSILEIADQVTELRCGF